VSVSGRAVELQRGINLEYAGLAYNILEAAVGVAAGLAAGSLALIGFGLDAVVESASAIVLILRFRSERTGARTSQEAEARAIRLVAGAFIVLALYVGISAIVQLGRGAHPESSAVGIGLACLSLIVMPYLAYRKTRLARDLGSRSLEADSRQTILCTYLSAILLVGLVANGLLGWWWADPVAALAIAAIAIREAQELWGERDVG
jgi:divalent metal cation (Fe/Co/Zn/Cd) transporter